MLFLIALIGALAGCSDDRTGVVVPMYRGQPNGDAAALAGELVVDGGCLYVDSGTERMQIAFPASAARWDEDEHTIVLSGGTAKVGQRVLFGGSSRPLTGQPAPDWETEPLRGCAGDWIWFAGDSVILDTP